MAPFSVLSTGASHVITRPPAIRSGGGSSSVAHPRSRKHLEATASPWYPTTRPSEVLAVEQNSRKLQPEPAAVTLLAPKPIGTLPSAEPRNDDVTPAPLDAGVIVSSPDSHCAEAVRDLPVPIPVAQAHVTFIPVSKAHAARPVALGQATGQTEQQHGDDPTSHAHEPASAHVAMSTAVAVPLAASSAPSVSYSERSSMRCNSVTVKLETSVKDAAGAIVHVLDRIHTLFMTALRSDGSHEALNRAVKSLAVARKYIRDAHQGWDLTFLPLHRTSGSSASNCEVDPKAAAVPDSNLFAFLVFKTIVYEPLKESDETDLNVSRGSDTNKMANAIMSVILDRGQAVMKAGGADALFVAMSAVINARHRLQRKYGFDLMMVPEWMTEDTTQALGRESKFLRFNILKCEMNGPMEHSVRPVLA